MLADGPVDVINHVSVFKNSKNNAFPGNFMEHTVSTYCIPAVFAEWTSVSGAEPNASDS